MTRHLTVCLVAALISVAATACDDAVKNPVADSQIDASPDAADTADTAEPACAPAVALPTTRLTIDGTRFRDALGREVLLRGANTGGRSKLPPFLPFAFDTSQGSATFAAAADRYFARMASWGLRTARMPFTWEALEPTRGTFDEAWLARYEAMVDAAGAHGIRVIVDFHQDLFARPYCGDGFPLWTLPQPIPERPEDCKTWFLGYFIDPQQRLAFDRLWANTDGIQDAMEAMWRFMAKRMWTHSAVIGFEVLNEPAEGSGEVETWAPEILTPFIDRMAAAIRAEAPGALIFFDSTGVEATKQTTSLRRPTGADLAFAPHFYDQTIFIAGDGDPAVAKAVANWSKQRTEWTLPVLIGEFGIPRSGGGVSSYSRAVWDVLDEELLHGTVWEYSDAPDEWNEEGMSLVGLDGQEALSALEAIRVYPSAVAGTITSFTFDRATLSATLVWQATEGTTELAAPARLYPTGPEATLTGVAGCTSWEDGVLRVRTSGAGAATLQLR
jgi:endoglycosylceramidase